MRKNYTYQNLIQLHLWQLTKKKSTWWLIAIFFLSGCYGLYQGFAAKEKQVQTITAFRQEQDSLLLGIKTGFNADTLTKEGKAAYRNASEVFSAAWNISLPVYKLPVSTSLYNIGQSDVFTYYYSIKVESFIMQLFKQTEISNPLRSLAGHFDTTFWIIYLLPLLALLLSFNTLSAELDNGNWRLIYSQGITPGNWLRSKLALTGIILCMLLLIIAIAGSIINYYFFKQSPGCRDILFFSSAILYLLFWLAILYLVNAFGRTTGFNAMAGGMAWIGICLLLPAIVSKTATLCVPADNTLISTFSRRPQNPEIEKSDAFARGLITKFSMQQPAYAQADTNSKKPLFRLRAYHAFHSILHEERWPKVQSYFRSVERRQDITNYSSILNPAGSIDGLLTSLAANDAAGNHAFVNEALSFHQRMQQVLYPHIFFDTPLNRKDYEQLPVFTGSPASIPPAIIWVCFFISIAILAIKKVADNKLKKIIQ